VVAMMVELVQILALSSFYCFINVIIDAASINLPFDIDFIFFFLQLIPILSPILPSFLSSFFLLQQKKDHNKLNLEEQAEEITK